MLEALLRWAARALAAILERFADPELDAKLKAFNEKAAKADELAKEAEREANISEAQYHLSLDRRKEFDRLLEESIAQEQESRSRLSASQERVRQIENETQRNIEAIRSRPDSERFGGVPKSG